MSSHAAGTFNPFSAAFLASNPAAIITLGFPDGLVQLVIAAMTIIAMAQLKLLLFVKPTVRIGMGLFAGALVNFAEVVDPFGFEARHFQAILRPARAGLLTASPFRRSSSRISVNVGSLFSYRQSPLALCNIALRDRI